MGKETRIAIFILFALGWVISPAGNTYGGPLPENQERFATDRTVITRDVEIYRSSDADQANTLKMIDLCRKLEDDWTQANANRQTELQVYRENTNPGVTEYRREVRESSQSPSPAGEQKIIELCHQLQDSARRPQESEVRVYRKTTVPHSEEGWQNQPTHPGNDD